MKKYNGILVPLVTPFTQDHKVDRIHLEKIIEATVAHGCHPFVMGTTGEGLSISEAGRQEVIETLSMFKNKGATLYASVSDVCYEVMVDRAKRYADEGIDVVVAHLPPHFSLSSFGMLKWFESLADESPCPVMLYNIPATTHMSIPLEIADRLSHHPNIVGLKDSEKDENRLREATSLWKEREDFCHFMGWAAKSFEALQMGSDGLVPSSANLIPEIYCIMYDAMQNGNAQEAKEMQLFSDEVGDIYQHGRLLPDSLSALKIMMHALDLCDPFVLPPLNRLDILEAEKLNTEFLTYYSTLKSKLD